MMHTHVTRGAHKQDVNYAYNEEAGRNCSTSALYVLRSHMTLLFLAGMRSRWHN